MEVYPRDESWAYFPLPPFMHCQRRVENKHSFLVLIFNQPLQFQGQWDCPTVPLTPPYSRPPHSHLSSIVRKRLYRDAAHIGIEVSYSVATRIDIITI